MNQTKNLTTAPEQFVLRRRIGSTLYRVRAQYSKTNQETLDDKILRLLKNDLNLAPGHGKMDLLQTGRLLEGSSV
jgi:hypothetical protein